LCYPLSINFKHFYWHKETICADENKCCWGAAASDHTQCHIYIFPAKSIDETTINEKQSQPWKNKYSIGGLNVALLELPQT
jgi:hypothetical protein